MEIPPRVRYQLSRCGPRADVCHADQGSLGKRQIEERGADGEGRAQANFLDQQEWSDRPQLVQSQDEGEHLAEFFAEALVVEADRRKQVAAQGNAHSGGDHHGAGEDGRAPQGKETSRLRLCT